jgi:hypothetical protein
MVGGVLHRSADPFWSSRLRNVRWQYDMYGLTVAGLGLPVSFGLFRRPEWARLLAMLVCWIIFVVYFGLPLFASLYYGVPVGPLLRIEGLVITAFAAVDVLALTRRGFRDSYSADSAVR